MTEPRWLSTTEQRAWRSWIDSARQIQAAVDRQLKDDDDLTIDDYEVMVRLSEAPDRRLRMSDLGSCIGNSPSRLSQRIDRMARRGLVCREPDAADRRVALVCLTDEGFRRLAAAAPGHVAEVRRVFIDRLTPADVDALARILPRILGD